MSPQCTSLSDSGRNCIQRTMRTDLERADLSLFQIYLESASVLNCGLSKEIVARVISNLMYLADGVSEKDRYKQKLARKKGE